jgi:hypothetical protein
MTTARRGRLRLRPWRQRVLDDAAVLRFLDSGYLVGTQRPRTVHVVTAQHPDTLRMREFVAQALNCDCGVDVSALRH